MSAIPVPLTVTVTALDNAVLFAALALIVNVSLPVSGDALFTVPVTLNAPAL